MQLFLRTTRNVSLTAAGKRFADELLPAMEQIDRAVSALSEVSERPSGRIRINADPAAAEQVMDTLILPFLAAYPEMEIEIAGEKRLVDIAKDGFDCGIRVGDLVAGDMIAVRISQPQQHIVVASPEYLAAHAPILSPADLVTHACIQLRMPSGNLYRWEFSRNGEALQIATSGRLVLTNSRLILAAVRAGLGLGYVNRWAASRPLSEQRIVQLLPDWTPPCAGLSLYYPRHHHLSAGMRSFVEFARKSVRN
ncbi:MAG: LysR family transcriptional regulator [Devosia sp.]|nr:LysR family transcriptional regulator [Devosia sp.]